MFALTSADLAGRILGCADGPASFNAEATRRGTQVTSCDPLYRYGGNEIRQRIAATYPTIMEQTLQNRQEFVWHEFSSPAELGQARLNAMEVFLADYDAGRVQGRYIAGELPTLPFDNHVFDLGLCSHFLFLYSDQLTLEFHVNAILELSRVAHEVRIFPVHSLGGVRSHHLEPVCSRLQESGLAIELKRVPYEFVRGVNQMMCLRPIEGQ